MSKRDEDPDILATSPANKCYKKFKKFLELSRRLSTLIEAFLTLSDKNAKCCDKVIHYSSMLGMKYPRWNRAYYGEQTTNKKDTNPNLINIKACKQGYC